MCCHSVYGVRRSDGARALGGGAGTRAASASRMSSIDHIVYIYDLHESTIEPPIRTHTTHTDPAVCSWEAVCVGCGRGAARTHIHIAIDWSMPHSARTATHSTR